MDNLALLWEYQLADLALENYQKELKDTPTRKKLLKLQRFIQAGQAKVQEMESSSRVTQNKISELEGQLKAEPFPQKHRAPGVLHFILNGLV